MRRREWGQILHQPELSAGAEVTRNPSPNENAFFAALQKTQRRASELVLLLPQRFVNGLATRGVLERVAERSGAEIRVGKAAPRLESV